MCHRFCEQQKANVIALELVLALVKEPVMELVLLHVKEVARVLVMVGALLVAKGRVQERVRMDVRVVLVSLL